MNTPTHVVANLLLMSRREQPRRIAPIVLGGLLPDLPMLLFYGVMKLEGVPEATIWGQEYFASGWQDFFDAFNSLPFIVVGFVSAWAARWPRLAVCFASMGLHVMGDLPVHREDGHRHLFPISDWRFESPVSYWDPAHHGAKFAVFELALASLCAGALVRRHPEPWVRGLVGSLVGIYLAFGVFAFWMWI